MLTRIYKLGSITTDPASGIKGMLTHVLFETAVRPMYYLFQPEGLSPEDGQPVRAHWLISEKITANTPTADIDLPLEVIGTQARDLASGFAGTVVSLTLHISGCVHVAIQPKGALKKTGAKADSCEFDIRRCAGPAIPVLTAGYVERDRKARPSPSHTPSSYPKLPTA